MPPALSRRAPVGAQRHSTQAQITAALSSDSSTAALLHVLGPLGQFVLFRRGLVDHRLDRRIEDFDNQDEQDAAGEQGALDAGLAEVEGGRATAASSTSSRKAASFFQAAAKPSFE